MAQPAYIPFIRQEDLILDNNRQIIPGAKIEIYDPVSNTPIDIYTYDGANENYTIASNPIYLNVFSRPEHTYFSDRLVLCRLYKYIGNFSDPRIDDDTDNWQFIREWNGSFTQEESLNDTIIYGIEQLKEASPTLSSVTVVGYWNAKDCEARTYVWDSDCVQSPDNGYIVKNNSLDTGRWILKFDGEYLPSTYYGVYPSKEANINALLSYIDAVGTNLMPTAPGVYFVTGNYNASTVALSTSKKLLIDSASSFTREWIQAYDVKIIGEHITHPICDFFFNTYAHNTNLSTAHSSWFRSLSKFLCCGANTFIIDDTNFFTDLKLYDSYALDEKVIIANKRINVDYNSFHIIINKCSIVGNKWIDASKDYIKFENMSITDRWFTSSNLDNFDCGNIADGHHIMANTLSLCTLALSNFDSADIWLKWQIANGITDINLEGRKVKNIIYDGLVNLTNAKFEKLNFNDDNGNLTITNSEGTIQNINTKYLNIFSSKIAFDWSPSNASSVVLTCNDSIISQSGLGVDNTWKNDNVDVRATNCTWSVAMDYTNDDNETAQQHNVAFYKCTLNKDDTYFKLKRCRFEDCVLYNQNIKIYPYEATGIDNAEHYYMNAAFVGNTIDSTYPIEFTKYFDDDCYGIYFRLLMVGNTFRNQGIDCRYWQNRGGSNYNKAFIASVYWVPTEAFENVEHHIFEYTGNVGNCPKENFKRVAFAKSNFVNNDDYNTVKTNSVDTQEIFPPLNQSLVNSPLHYNGVFLNTILPVGYYAVTHGYSGDLDHPTGITPIKELYSRYYQADYDEGVENGSLFNMGVGIMAEEASWDEVNTRVMIY